VVAVVAVVDVLAAVVAVVDAAAIKPLPTLM
jgi:hypothetical protein